MKKCIICGKKCKDKETLIQAYKLPHGTIHLCHDHKCQKMLTLLINDFAAPIIWVSKADLYEKDFIETLTEEECNNLTPEDILELAADAEDMIGNDNSFGFRETLDCVAEEWRKEKERKLIETTPLKELPLLIEDLKYDSNKSFLEMRLKEGK